MKKRFLYHRRLMYETFKEYMETSSFIDTTGRVTAEAINRFKDLFLDNAMVYGDYSWEPKMIDVDRYADEVFFYHRIRGLKVEYEKDVLNQFFSLYREAFNPRVDTTDPTNNTYRYEFIAKKGVYYILNKKNEVLYYDEPIEYELKFVFYVSSADKWAKIIDIMPVERNN